ncbi:hypothetical protein GOODEAATRI_011340 [Goodea atripinnis]|uniref:Uncharacterized protein n=1 Tax=Goodea atripinnis TaxID=208336 RepID=A0ABV0NJE4_9TELE
MDISGLTLLLSATVFIATILLAIVCLDCRNKSPLAQILLIVVLNGDSDPIRQQRRVGSKAADTAPSSSLPSLLHSGAKRTRSNAGQNPSLKTTTEPHHLINSKHETGKFPNQEPSSQRLHPATLTMMTTGWIRNLVKDWTNPTSTQNQLHTGPDSLWK